MSREALKMTKIVRKDTKDVYFGANIWCTIQNEVLETEMISRITQYQLSRDEDNNDGEGMSLKEWEKLLK